MVDWRDVIWKPWREDFEEVLEEDYLRFRVGQCDIWRSYWNAAAPIPQASRGACRVSERQGVPAHLGRHQFPAQALAVAPIAVWHSRH